MSVCIFFVIYAIKAFKTVVRKNHEIADDIGHNGKEIKQKLYNCLSNNDKNTIIEITNYYKEELHRININDSENLEYNSKSTFDGKLIQMIGWNLLGALITILSLGICFPIAVNWFIK